MRARSLGAVVALSAVVGALGLTGCGHESSPPPRPSASAPVHDKHTPTDVAFAQSMIPLLAQETDIATMAGQQAESPRLKDLAQRLPDEQRRWQDSMTALLQEWNVQPPEGSTPATNGYGSISGMASDQEMQQLSQASGAAFDTQSSQLAKRLHQGAITIANRELSNGQSARMKTIARDIVNAKQHEISELQSAGS